VRYIFYLLLRNATRLLLDHTSADPAAMLVAADGHGMTAVMYAAAWTWTEGRGYPIHTAARCKWCTLHTYITRKAVYSFYPIQQSTYAMP
jgi:hypothetical protein